MKIYYATDNPGKKEKKAVVKTVGKEQKSGSLKEAVMAVVDEGLRQKRASSLPLSGNWAANQTAQFQLISYFTKGYEAQKHNKNWFLNRFDLDHGCLSELYDYYQENKGKQALRDAPLFSVFLFSRLQEEAAAFLKKKNDGAALQKVQDEMSVYFHAARYHGHSKALLSGKGTAEKQRDHIKKAAFTLEGVLQKIPPDAKRDEIAQKVRQLGFPNAKFSLPQSLRHYCEKSFTVPDKDDPVFSRPHFF